MPSRIELASKIAIFSLTAVYTGTVLAASGAYPLPNIFLIVFSSSILAATSFSRSPLAASLGFVFVFSLAFYISPILIYFGMSSIGKVVPLAFLVGALSAGSRSVKVAFISCVLLIIFFLTSTQIVGDWEKLGFIAGVVSLLLIGATLMFALEDIFEKAIEPAKLYTGNSIRLILAFMLVLITANILLGSAMSLVEAYQPGHFVLKATAVSPSLIDFLVACTPMLINGSLVGIEPQTLLSRVIISTSSIINLLLMVVYANIILKRIHGN